jgi:CRISPR-associated protein Cmr1
MKIKLKTLTPLWLGDIDRDSGGPKESGLIGSLRFWYEGLLRERGIRACEITDVGKCSGLRDYCEACKLFGGTGLARRFRLEIEGLDRVRVFFKASPNVAVGTGNWLWNIFGGEQTGGSRVRDGQTTRYTFGVHALWGSNFTLTLSRRLSERDDSALGRFALALTKAAEYGGIGAKTQYGFGQVRIVSEVPKDLLDQARARLDEKRGNAQALNGAFTLHSSRFFSLRYRIPPSAVTGMRDIGEPPPGWAPDQLYIPCAFDIRYKYNLRNPRTGAGRDEGIRPAIRDRFGESITKEIFGFVRGADARASRIHVSHLYRESPKDPYLLKIWGDVDRKAEIESIVHEQVRRRFPSASYIEEKP